jgi:tetratricopeptide (TPR) repeat protein
MVDQIVVDLAADGRASVASWPDGDDFPSAGEPFDLTWPLNADALEDLRWYLEDYLVAPFGVYGERGPAVQARLADWGAAVFGVVFGSGPARDAYVKLRARQGAVKLLFRSSSPELLGLPWELMRDPARPTPLALDLAGVSRSLPTAELADTLPVPGGKLRVLMVISRPAGGRDVGYQMIARPLLRRLEAVRGEVDLVVLRPPTMDALTQTLAEAAERGEPFQVVHFDGHGVLRRSAAGGGYGSDMFAGQADEGVLAFEKPGGGSDQVPAAKIAQVLKRAQVPVVVLNACHSGAIGQDLSAAVATRLLQEGTASVVAMAYSVYAVAAAEFMAAFYERLFAGDPVSAAVAAGRQRMFTSDRRPSPKGALPLADWLIPVHYLRRDVSFPHAKTDRTGLPSLAEALDQLGAAKSGDGTGDLEPVGVFTGRDALFYELEEATRLRRVVVLHGPGGTGKTELAKAFGRWWRDTGGVERADLVFFHSFEPGLATFGLDGVVNEIGRHVFGTEFDQLEPADRRAVVDKVLAEHRMLLIWDNFESVRSMTAGETTAVPDDLRDFLARLATRGRSAVLVTSRSPEPWLGDIRRAQVVGLTSREADEYADYLLAPYPAARPRRAVRAFGELLEWLAGHPLSMRLILPHLDTIDPAALLDALRGAKPLPGEGGDAGRLTSLSASIAYSYTHLSEPTRRLLPAVCLFQGVADEDVLMLFSTAPAVPGRFTGVTKENWRRVLDEAAGVGLLTLLGVGMYRIHPALPAYLADRWREEEPVGHDTMRETATGALVTAYAVFGDWLERQIESGDAGLAFTVIGLHRRTMGHLLDHALARELWAEASDIVQPLTSYWDARGLAEEAGAWTDRVLLAAEDADGTAPQTDTPAGRLWLFIAGARASRELVRLRLDDAERTYDQIRVTLEAQPPSPKQKRDLAVTYHQLGTVAQGEGRLEEAAEWYGRSLTIEVELGNRQGIASSYHQLGAMAQDLGRLEEAAEWYGKSLAISEDLGDRQSMASSCHQLGVVAQRLGQIEEAAEWYGKSLAISENLGNRPYMASSYHQLGRVAQDLGRLEEAAEWYGKSLAISEDLGDRRTMASSYHQLGMVAQHGGRLKEAAEWYGKSLAIEKELGNRPGVAFTSGQLGLLAMRRGDARLALEWTVRCVAVFGEFPHPLTGPGPQNLARLTTSLGIGVLEETWRQVTGSPLPHNVREYVSRTGESNG